MQIKEHWKRNKYIAAAFEAGMDVNAYLEAGLFQARQSIDQLSKDSKFIEHINHLPQPRILEIGAGTGRFTLEISRIFKNIESYSIIEIDPIYVEFLSEYPP
jgi:protein-L-isoaspartate O-methyltransferase